TRTFDSHSDTKYYINKSYDYSCNSSNASQASTLDQANDKYYDDEHFGKKSYDADKARPTKEPRSFFLDLNHHQAIIGSDQEDSHRSSQSECMDLNMDNSSQTSANFDINYNKLGRADLGSQNGEATNSPCELSDDFDLEAKATTARNNTEDTSVDVSANK